MVVLCFVGDTKRVLRYARVNASKTTLEKVAKQLHLLGFNKLADITVSFISILTLPIHFYLYVLYNKTGQICYASSYNETSKSLVSKGSRPFLYERM